MAFEQAKLERSVSQSRDIFNKYIYKTSDSKSIVSSLGYFSASRFAAIDGDGSDSPGWVGGIIECFCSDGYLIGQIQGDGREIF